MIKQPAAQSRAHGKRGFILCFLALFLSSALVCSPLQAVQAASETGQDNQPAIVRVYNQVIDWTASAWQAVKNWIIEQGTHIARAFSFWSKESAAQTPTPEPQVLGEEVDHPPTPSLIKEGELPTSPLTYRTELIAPAKIPEPVAGNNQTPISKHQENTNNQSPISEPEPDTALVEQAPDIIPAPVETPQTTPAPETTPEFLPAPVVTPQPEEPKKQNNSYYIPILARDTLPPTSAVTALSATTTSAIFAVSWTGEDKDITGSPAVASFDIQYQVDSGDWQDWIAETVLLSSLFDLGADEHIYGFRSRARDRYSNLGNYSDNANTSTYLNLSVPHLTIDTPASSSTLLSTTVDEIPATGDVEVTIYGTGDNGDIITITLGITTATTTVESLAWSKRIVLVEGANNFTIQAQEADGDITTNNTYTLTLELVPTHEVVINEIAWMGTTAALTADEWIELYNPGNSSVDISGGTLIASSTTPNITIGAGKTIAAKSYFLLERTDDNTVSDISADQFYTGALVNGGDLLKLRKSNGSLVDKAGSTAPAWLNAGDNDTKQTMERKDPTGDGTLASNWATNDGVLINGKASDTTTNIKGTPKSLNSQNTTIPRVVTNLQQQYIYTTTTSVRLYWTTPKFGNLSTPPTAYDIRYYASSTGNCPITDTESSWGSATQVTTGEPVPSTTEGAVATATVTGLTQNTSYCFALKTSNGVETSGLSNIFNGNTYDAGFTTLGFGGDTVSANTTIATSTKPYLVNRNFTVAPGVTLTVNPGVVIKMNTSGSQKGCNTNALSCAITVSGSLILGSASDVINAAVITSSKDDTYAGDANGDGASTGTAGDWDKITAGTATSAISVNHGIVAYGGYNGNMIVMSAGTATISNSIIKNSSGYGIAISGDLTSLTLTNSTVQDNLEGIGISTLANANIQGSTFTGNHRGIAIGTTADEANLHIGNTSGNNFYANNRVAGATPFAGIHYSDTTGTLTAENNWWGSASGPTTSSPDGDASTDAAMADTTAVIDYTPFAISAFSILPSGL